MSDRKIASIMLEMMNQQKSLIQSQISILEEFLHSGNSSPAVVEGGPKTKKQKQEVDPNKPKRYLTGYQLYVSENQPKVREEYPNLSPKEIVAFLGQQWKSSSEDIKKLYTDKSAVLKAVYDQQMKEYAVSHEVGEAIQSTSSSSSSSSSENAPVIVTSDGEKKAPSTAPAKTHKKSAPVSSTDPATASAPKPQKATSIASDSQPASVPSEPVKPLFVPKLAEKAKPTVTQAPPSVPPSATQLAPPSTKAIPAANLPIESAANSTDDVLEVFDKSPEKKKKKRHKKDKRRDSEAPVEGISD